MPADLDGTINRCVFDAHSTRQERDLQTQRYRRMSADVCAAPASGTGEVSP